MANIFVIYELRDNNIKKVSLEATGAAVELSEQISGKVSVLLMGYQIEHLAEIPASYGAQNVFLVDNEKLATYSPDVWARLIGEIAEKKGATHILMGASAMGKDLLPRVGFHLNTPVAQDITGFEYKDGKLTFIRPVIAGKLNSEIQISSDFQLATLRPNVFTPKEQKVTPQTEKLSIDIPEPRIKLETFIASAGGKLDVAEADIIVSGGRGLQGPENWHLIEDLAEVLGAATGASRAVVDAGWRDHAEQVGQTGKTVSPSLYVACGISGAIQHQAGMATSKYIVAINKDAEAPIFKLADYGIVGDVFEILPKFTEELKKVKS
ncbi:MAG: electron transfer flavoprotein subunit alpha/FixB family protein [Calditrichaeota bacterium]|nr:MAG: electron transfer flavoprotein subunit alpha/FixB family protein [Calditrichota bacterium]